MINWHFYEMDTDFCDKCEVIQTVGVWRRETKDGWEFKILCKTCNDLWEKENK